MTWQKTYPKEEIQSVVAELKAWGAGIPRWLFSGPMGAGKTTLVRHWIGSEVQSPTFTYINAYEGGVYHIDLYRFGPEEYPRWEAVYEILSVAPLVFVEWAEKLPWPVPAPYVTVQIEILGPLHRRLMAQAVGAYYQ